MSRPPSRSLARTSSICSLTVTRFYGGFQSIRLSASEHPPSLARARTSPVRGTETQA